MSGLAERKARWRRVAAEARSLAQVSRSDVERRARAPGVAPDPGLVVAAQTARGLEALAEIVGEMVDELGRGGGL